MVKGRIPGLVLLSSLFVVSSCGLIDSTRQSLLGDSNEQDSRKGGVVPRAQYEELVNKYEELKQKYNLAKGENQSDKPIVAVPSEVEAKPAPAPMPANGAANAATASSGVAPLETVDVFASVNSGAAVEASGNNANDYAEIYKETVDEQLNYYQKALNLLSNNKKSEATKIFQKLSLSPIIPIRARAKRQTGEIFMASGEWDLALQVYEDILAQDASSGVVLSVLEKLVICSDKLALTEKKAKYHSLLKDIFEIGV